MKKILITGATGQLGTATINALLNKNYPAAQIVALVRDNAKAASFAEKGLEVRVGDYNDVASLAKAFEGIDTLLFISASDIADRTKQHKNVVDTLNNSTIQEVVYTSFVGKKELGASAIHFIADAHVETEKWLKESGKSYTFLHNNLYMDFVPVFIGEQVLETGVYFPAGNGKMAAVTRDDLAEATANVLMLENRGKVYNFSNSESWSYAQVAETLESVSGTKVDYTSPSQEEYKETLAKAGVPGDYIGMFAAFGEATKRNELDTPGHELENVLGRKPVSLKSFFQSVYQK